MEVLEWGLFGAATWGAELCLEILFVMFNEGRGVDAVKEVEEFNTPSDVGRKHFNDGFIEARGERIEEIGIVSEEVGGQR